MDKQVVPSILSADFSCLRDEIRAVEETGAQRIHLDIMDGHFVPNLSFGPMIAKTVRKITDGHLEAHLMMTNPAEYIAEFAQAGVDTIMIQQETCPHLHGDLNLIRKQGASPGVVVNPGTPVELIKPVLPDIDQILIMTVNPGFGGQEFIESMVEKISETRRLIGSRNIRLQVDGGIDLTTIDRANQAGADLFVVGSSIFGEPDPGEAFHVLQQKLRVVA